MTEATGMNQCQKKEKALPELSPAQELSSRLHAPAPEIHSTPNPTRAFRANRAGTPQAQTSSRFHKTFLPTGSHFTFLIIKIICLL